MIIKNTASQGVYVFAKDTTTGLGKASDSANITASISLDGAAAGATNDVNPTEIGGGTYWFDLTQAETNADMLAIYAVSATGDVAVDPILATTTDSEPATVAAIRTEIDSNSTQLAAVVADTNELQTDWANGGRLDLILDTAAAGTGGSGATQVTLTIDDGSTAVADVDVRIRSTNDVDAVPVASGRTDNAGQVVFLLDAGTYYRWAEKSGIDFTNPQTITVS